MKCQRSQPRAPRSVADDGVLGAAVPMSAEGEAAALEMIKALHVPSVFRLSPLQHAWECDRLFWLSISLIFLSLFLTLSLSFSFSFFSLSLSLPLSLPLSLSHSLSLALYQSILSLSFRF